MATDELVYLPIEEAISLHIFLMRSWDELYFGVDRRDLIESAIARPQQAAVYEGADMIRQAASMCFGLIKNHPWVGGNKRTATFLMEAFLELNGSELAAEDDEIVQAALDIEADRWGVDEIEAWLRQRVVPTKD
ncbi:MAG TPA: type II toxin-antitoxin system death-on-curing family toxin [Pyrinomonadaceae bacterium]|mgnify:CR=1 FL=1|nr:type II toxin-antitoxin system death-on-curing family toxin [Pyrinomonadaceae bacterium]